MCVCVFGASAAPAFDIVLSAVTIRTVRVTVHTTIREAVVCVVVSGATFRTSICTVVCADAFRRIFDPPPTVLWLMLPNISIV